MKSIKKTNAVRLLDLARVEYELVNYDVDPENLAATHVAESLGENVKQVFKTIVLTGDKVKYFVCVVPGDKEINLKLAAIASGNKKCCTLPLKDLFSTTGYIRGGCSPIGMKKLFPTYIDSSALKFSFIFVSGGQRGLQIKIVPTDLALLSRAQFVQIIQ